MKTHLSQLGPSFWSLLLIKLIVPDTQSPKRSSDHIEFILRIEEIVQWEINKSVRSGWVWGFGKVFPESGEFEFVLKGLGLFVWGSVGQ